MVQFFKGQLASVYLLLDQTETTAAFSCLHKNHEMLRFNAVGQLISGEVIIGT